MKALILAASTAVLVGCAAGAAAHDAGKKDAKKVRTVIIHKDGEGATASHGAHVMIHGAGCKDATVKSDVDVETPAADGKTQRTRVLICNSEKDEAKARAHALEALTKALGNLAGRELSELSDEHRTKALAALDAEIARLKQQ